MSKIFIAFALFMTMASAQSQVRMPQPSPLQSTTQDFGIGKIELSYSRPSAKGRKIFGDLVAYDKLWRTGANEAPKIKITEPIMIMGSRLDTGTYYLLTVPGRKSWEIVINKGKDIWGVEGHKKEEDVLRVSVPTRSSKTYTETFTIAFTDMKPESCTMLIAWENTEVPVSLTADFREKLRNQLEEALKKDEKKPYWSAAQFYNEYDKNYPKAQEYAVKACEANEKAYWVWLYRARIEKQMGNVDAARTSATKSMELAKDAGNDDYVKMAKELLKEIK